MPVIMTKITMDPKFLIRMHAHVNESMVLLWRELGDHCSDIVIDTFQAQVKYQPTGFTGSDLDIFTAISDHVTSVYYSFLAKEKFMIQACKENPKVDIRHHMQDHIHLDFEQFKESVKCIVDEPSGFRQIE